MYPKNKKMVSIILILGIMNIFFACDATHQPKGNINDSGAPGVRIPNDLGYNNLSVILTLIDAPKGWAIARSGGPIVAIIDSGVISNHPDLPVLLPGYSAVSTLSPNEDKRNHGTGVAGTVGALGNNGIGGVGINWNAKILPVKADASSGTFSAANINKCIRWAVDNGAKIINLSLGTSGNDFTIKAAIDYAYNKGAAIFAASGNESRNSINFPAGYSNVMAVGATFNGTSRADTSNYGPGLDVVAIVPYYTTTAEGEYASRLGTSFASPQVAGLASLIWAINPNLTNEQVYKIIRDGAKPLGGGYNEETGYGLINIYNSLLLAKATLWQ